MSASRSTRFGLASLLLAMAVFIGCQEPAAPGPGPTTVAKTPVVDEIPTTPPKLPDSETEPAPASTPDSSSVSATTPTEPSDPAPAARNTDDPPSEETPANDKGDKDDQKPKSKNGKPTGQKPPAQKPEPPKDDVLKLNKPMKPFRHELPVEEFSKDLTWLNTGGPLRKQDLKGKFVLLDFWTYCCINCMHILPELKKLEQAYPNNLVVIGVHSAKFDGEKDTKNIEEAILRYDIEHPVINDADHKVWDSLGVQSWPTILMLDPEGFAVWGRSGEFKFEQIDKLIKDALPYYRENGLLDETPIRFDLLSERQKPTVLRFPGKLLADEKGGRLFITDSNHHRIVISTLDGKLLDTIGSSEVGRADGDFATASFHHPQGLVLSGETLYVADTENHLLRKIDLAKKTVATIAGTGEQSRSGWPGSEGLTAVSEIPERWVGPPKTTALNSPWDLWIHGSDLYLAMAGPHQIWKMPLDESEIGPFAGNGREDIVDGPLLPKMPYDMGYSSFAQPSGLASDGKWLFVADSEGSSIRAVPFDGTKEVRTIVGTAKLPFARLFTFGDIDGPANKVRLQHALGVAYHDGKIFVADTYNNKIKVVDAATGETRTLAGSGKPGHADGAAEEATFDEPAGLTFAAGKLFVADTNSHLIRVVDPEAGGVSTLTIAQLAPPIAKKKAETKPDFTGAAQVKVKPVSVKPADGEIKLTVKLTLPAGWKTNPLGPMSYYLEAAGDAGPIDRKILGKKKVDPPADEFTIKLPTPKPGDEKLTLSLRYYYCQEGAEGLCKVGAVVFQVPLKITDDAPQSEARLSYTVTEAN